VTWLQWFLGFQAGDGNGAHYLFWSGIGSDIGEVAILGWLYAFLRRHNCEVHGCWRLGRHTTAGGHVVCKRHHPAGKITPELVRMARAAAQRPEARRHS